MAERSEVFQRGRARHTLPGKVMVCDACGRDVSPTERTRLGEDGTAYHARCYEEEDDER